MIALTILPTNLTLMVITQLLNGDINIVVAVPECEADETMPVSDHRISSELCVEQRSSLLDLLSKHNTLFSDVPGLTNSVSFYHLN